jgi:hypothetical protein
MGLGKLSLEIKATEPRKAHVENEASRDIRSGSTEKRLGAWKHLHPQSYRGDESAERVADGSIVVHHKDDRALGAHRVSETTR